MYTADITRFRVNWIAFSRPLRRCGRRSVLRHVVDAAVLKLLWVDESSSHAVIYYCGHVADDGRCDPASLFINVMRRDDVKSAITRSSLDHMSIALRTACLEPGDLHISDQQGKSSSMSSV